MILFKRNESDETDLTIYEAVSLLDKEDVEQLLLVYFYNYIVFNDGIADLKKKFINYDKKKLTSEEYVNRVAQILNDTVPGEWVDDIIAISYGLYQNRLYKNLKDNYKFKSEYITIGSICEKILTDKLNRGSLISESRNKKSNK